ncbi:MAG: PPOX class F420-dependent oxidoreductase [Actinomycetia bacterium]|nr:PPOX class F420-dependent oxidoreductase [Actinomycetes bacterium]
MKKIPRTDRRAQHIATNTEVDLPGLIDWARGRHQLVLATTRRDGRPQLSLVTGVLTEDGEVLISTYPQRAKARNIARNGEVSVLIMGQFDGAWVQVDGAATVVEMPEAGDGLVEYFRAISGEHSDWDEYRQAMADQGKALIRVRPTRWGPIATGGFPPELFE